VGMHMGHVALRVPDIDAYVAYVTEALGLQVLERRADEAFLACQPTRHELQLITGDAPEFDHVGLMIESDEEFESVVDRAITAGGALRDDDGEERGCRRSAVVVGPAGVAHQLYVPTELPVPTLDHRLDGRIRRLGHLTFLSVEAQALVGFWQDGLGFRLSDAAAGFTWMRCDPYHHTLAVGPHPAATVMHHHAWEIQDVSALARHCDRNGAAGRPQMWGPVRHGPGFNIATYMADPAGSLIEVYTDLLTIEDNENYEPMDWSDQPLALNLWGTMPSPEAFGAGVPVVPARVEA
jgi:catechol-2,3-dioxygenase